MGFQKVQAFGRSIETNPARCRAYELSTAVKLTGTEISTVVAGEEKSGSCLKTIEFQFREMKSSADWLHLSADTLNTTEHLGMAKVGNSATLLFPR